MFKLSKPDMANDLQQKRNGKECLCVQDPTEFVPETLLKHTAPKGSAYFFWNFVKQHWEGGEEGGLGVAKETSSL